MSEFRSFRSLVDMPFFLPAATFALVVILWQLAADIFAIPSFILPSPTRILGGFGQIDLARWTEHVWATLRSH